MQVEPIKSLLKGPGINRLKLKYDEPLSNVGFNFNLRRYNEGFPTVIAVAGRRRSTVSKPVFKASMVSALETII